MNLYIENPRVKNEYAKFLIADEMRKKIPNLKCLYNSIEEERHFKGFKNFFIQLGLLELVEKIKPLEGRMSIVEKRLLKPLRDLPEILKFDDSVEDLLDHWAIYYQLLEADGTRVSSSVLEGFPPVLVHKETGVVTFSDMRTVFRMRAERKMELDARNLPKSVSYVGMLEEVRASNAERIRNADNVSTGKLEGFGVIDMLLSLKRKA